MRVPLSWLNDYIDLEAVGLSPEAMSESLTLLGLEVDAIETVGAGFSGVVVAKVTATRPHPDADSLALATVTDGNCDHEVVCGAPNCRVGLVTAFAPIGARLTDEGGKTFKIRKTKIRGIESCGMLCSESELGLGTSHEGIIELDAGMSLGTDLAIEREDTVLEVSLTPNLAHCMSMIGVARELAASAALPVRKPEVLLNEAANAPTSKAASVLVANKDRCPRYCCRVINGVSMGSSPAWLQQRLELAGVRAINNIVDITNYVLMETGHPLHAFDFDKLAGHRIEVRLAEEGETFTTLDNIERRLKTDDLLICDAEKPIALAGVMGGQNSEVSDTTVNVLLESAYFEPRGIRRASRRLGLLTESSSRFERGCDPNNVVFALDRAAALIQELAGGTVCEGIIDARDQDFPDKRITCRLSRINALLGTELVLGEVQNIFERLGFPSEWDGSDALALQIPTYRGDITTEVDLIEEVARVYGFDNIPKEKGVFTSSTFSHAPMFLFEREVRSRLVAMGLQELMTSDLISPDMVKQLPEDIVPEASIVKVMNPSSIDQSVLRPSLLPGLLDVVKYNSDRQHPNIRGFEIGRVHFRDGDRYMEQSTVGVVLAGQQSPRQWGESPREGDFYDIKGILENIFESLGLVDVEFANSQYSTFHTGRQAGIHYEGIELGSIGEIHPAITRKLDVPTRIYFAVLNLHELLQKKAGHRQMKPLPAFPGSERDWTLTLNEQTEVSNVLDTIKQVPSKTLETVTVIDVYRSEKIGADKKNVTLRFFYRDQKKTLDQERVDKSHQRIVEHVSASL